MSKFTTTNVDKAKGIKTLMNQGTGVASGTESLPHGDIQGLMKQGKSPKAAPPKTGCSIRHLMGQ
jgi:hypothetical protein